MKVGVTKHLPVNEDRLIQQTVTGTIRTVLDALVEVITNSDDSYKRIERKGNNKSGLIKVTVSRLTGGACKFIEVRDYAEGMDKKALLKAIKFGEASSGFEKGESVRGLFGRGLKEAILSLGVGEIYTFRNFKFEGVRIWAERDGFSLHPKFAWLELSHEDIDLLKIEEGTGTIVRFTKICDEYKIPDYQTFEKQLTQHYALRDINTSVSRRVKLIFESPQSKKVPCTISDIKYSVPAGTEVLNEPLRIPKYQDQMILKIFKSPEILEAPPMGQSGILIKTEGAILDNQLFNFQDKLGGQYFFGEAFVKGIADRARAGDYGIINIVRAGLNWRDDFCKAIQEEIEEKLKPFIDDKNRELEKPSESKISISKQKLLSTLQDLLNKLAKTELSSEELEVPIDYREVDDLIIKPEVANIEIGIPRTLTVYAPKFLVESCGTNEVKVFSETPHIRVSVGSVRLEPHSKYPDIYCGHFKVTGTAVGVKSIISATLGKYYALAEVSVGTLKHRKRGNTLMARKGGFISDIKTSGMVNPKQRASYDRDFGIVWIYTKFPSVSRYIDENLEGVEKPDGSLMLAEIVGELFCREMARRGVESGRYPAMNGDPPAVIALYDRAYSDMQNKYLDKIVDIVSRWKPND